MLIEENNLVPETQLEVTLEKYLQVLAKRIVSEIYWLVFGQISAWSIVFLLFKDQFGTGTYNKAEIVTFVGGCFVSVAVLSYFQLKLSARHLPCCLVISNQFSALMHCSLVLNYNKSFRDDFESNRPQWVYILSMQFTLAMLNMIMQTIWKGIEAIDKKKFVNSRLLQSAQDGVQDRLQKFRATLLEAEELAENITLKNIVKMLLGRKKFHNFVKFFMKGSILLFAIAINFDSASMWALFTVASLSSWLIALIFLIVFFLLFFVFSAIINLCLKLLHSTEIDDAKTKIIRYWCIISWCFKWLENCCSCFVYSSYILIYPSQVLFIAKLSSYTALAATIFYGLSSWLKRKVAVY